MVRISHVDRYDDISKYLSLLSEWKTREESLDMIWRTKQWRVKALKDMPWLYKAEKEAMDMSLHVDDNDVIVLDKSDTTFFILIGIIVCIFIIIFFILK